MIWPVWTSLSTGGSPSCFCLSVSEVEEPLELRETAEVNETEQNRRTFDKRNLVKSESESCSRLPSKVKASPTSPATTH